MHACASQLEKPTGGNKSNLPSISGGIFEDHSGPTFDHQSKIGRSQKSSVPGGIFAAASRPVTVEYGYEKFPRQGLDVIGGGGPGVWPHD